ncbi:MAG: dolichyl-diphosphooligosaccharide--protein glycosyltransferase subunit STT3, partial [Candidatus Heimdallarchaeota archaeon]|nr:dolichyl-diphosphooligosaccharide--protein glycosyltransferase subunit STT3 [Candidatus Heimdallarchaeota archaeon]
MSTQEIDLVDWLKERYENIKKSIVDHFDEYTLSKQKVAHHISLTLTLIISLLIRLFPTFKGWEPTIKAFDPYMQLRSAEYILEHGLLSFFYWHDYYSWYPYGRPMGISMYIAVPLAIILIYKVGLFLGFNMILKVAAYLVPVVFGVIAVYFMYLLGKELISPRAGLIAALLMSVAPAFLTRSIAGFVDNESVGVLFTIMTLYFFSRSILRDSNRSGIFAGLSMFLLGSSWGAFRFTYDLLAVIAMVFVISGKFSPRFFKTYLYTLSVSVYFMIGIPRIGGSFVMGTEGLAPIGMIVFLILISVLQNVSKDLHPDTFRRIIVTGFMSITILMTIILIILNAVDSVDSIGSKFISVILPTERNDLPLIDSVSEHLPMAWGNLYANVSTLVFFIPLGIYYGIRKPTEKNLIILTFGIITILFSGSMVRLMLLLAPAAILLTALAIDSLLIPYAYVAHGRIKLSKTTMTLPSITGQNSALTYFIVYCLILVMLGTSINRADRIANPELTPSLSESGSPNDAVTDWLDAFTWMQEHTSYEAWAADNLYSGLGSGQPPVMLSWWDYGYYITNQGGTVTLADNATSNSTQIGVVGTML